MRRVSWLSVVLLAVLAILWSCSKRSSPPPTAPAPACTVTPTSLDFGSVEVGLTSSTKSFAVTNSGGGTLSGSVSESCPDFEIVSGAGSYSLGAGESRTVSVRLHPASAGSKTCTVATGCSQGVALTGVASAASCQLTPASLDFGSVTVGQSDARSFTLRNQGTTTLTGTLTESCPDYAIESSASYSLAAGASASFTIRFSPTQAGSQSCTISTGTAGCPSISATGTGVAANPACEVSVSGLLFPQVAVGDRADATFELRNAGTATLSGTITESCPDFSIPGQASYSLAPAASQTFIVRFEPSAVGEQTCQVSLGGGCSPLSCWGSGVVGCTYTPSLIEFGYFRPGDIRCGSLTLTNNTATLQSGALTAEQIGWYTGQIRLDGVLVSGTGSVSYSLNAGQSRTFTLCWTAELIAGQPTRCDTTLGEWRIRSTNGSCDDVYATIKGIITYGCECTVTPTTMDFGTVVVGDASAEQTISIANQSRIAGLKGAVRVLSGDFEVSRSDYACGCSGCSSDVRVRFRPLSLGPRTGKIVVESLVGCLGPGAGSLCDTVTVSGVGVTAGGPGGR